LEFHHDEDFFNLLETFGHAPIPPYISKARSEEVRRQEDLTHYQTVYAEEYGAIAAPTAGLHFTEDILRKIADRNIEIVEVTLHVGLGTFEPIRVDDISQHQMHTEHYFISPKNAERITAARKQNRKIVAVGTTSSRTLEAAWRNNSLQSGHHTTDIFIYPPYRFKAVDQLLTNFHLPESTLIMLISALAGKDFIMEAYQCAIREKYRFYSYGDCMLIQ
jgi:S-adenosylmethionine:tRNA ribosyltransferase-isomerase